METMILFKMDIFCNITNTVTFDKFHVSMSSSNMDFLLTQTFERPCPTSCFNGKYL